MKNDGPSQYGRATRHMDVFQCPVGAFGMYLLYRLDCNGEFDVLPDFKCDEEWFDIKVLCEFGTGESTKVMTQRPFQNSMREVFAELGICSTHHGHFGRVTGPVYAEFKELPP